MITECWTLQSSYGDTFFLYIYLVNIHTNLFVYTFTCEKKRLVSSSLVQHSTSYFHHQNSPSSFIVLSKQNISNISHNYSLISLSVYFFSQMLSWFSFITSLLCYNKDLLAFKNCRYINLNNNVQSLQVLQLIYWILTLLRAASWHS